MYARKSRERRSAGPRSRVLMVLAAASAVALGATGLTHVGAPAPSGVALSTRLSPDQQLLAELRERLSPELARRLDEVGRLVSLEELLRAGALDELERPVQPEEPEASWSVEEETSPDGPAIPPVLSAKKSLDVDLFEQNIRDILDGATVGYAYSIWKAGQPHSEDGVGDARVDPDAPVTAQSATKPMTIASVSKPVTATVVLDLLGQKGMSVDDPIGPWLPQAWLPGDGVEEITFRELMTHKSGLLQNFQAATGTTGGESTGSWDNIRIAVGQDIGSKSYRYANMNFSIFRILVPKIAFGFDLSVPYDSPEPGVAPEQYDYLTGLVFLGHLQSVLTPADAPISCASTETNPTRLYAFPTNGAAGWGPVSYVLGCGGYGYYMSANAIGSFLSHLRHTEVLLTPAWRKIMFDGRLGLKGYTGAHGTYLGHAGVWAMSGGRGMRGCVMMFPNQVEVTLLVNNRGDYPPACDVVREAFDTAWT